jgi:tRNA nucleotidyltransferase/poly(A) polymerase
LTMSPRILERPQHTLSRKAIDPDALKVLYRLKNNGYVAYLVGGGVRDLLLGRKPKDFDIGTSAHPQQVKRLFRNCFVIGRRFRLCHIRFGRKVVEVSTFRRQAEPEQGDTLIRRDNTFGTPEEDAFRRDFTVNALFYDIATFSVIDYVEGLEDLESRVIRTIGDPAVRFREDPVRMLRAVALAARLGFTIDRDTAEAIRFLRGEIVKSSPARILDELYKVLRQGASRKTFQMLHDLGLLAYLLPEAEKAIEGEGERLLGSLSRLDDYRNAGLAAPEDLTNPLLMGTLLVPLGVPLRRAVPPRRGRPEAGVGDEAEAEADALADDLAAEMAALGAMEPDDAAPAGPVALALPFARRDLDRLRLILAAQNRLREVHRSPRVKQMLAGRGYLEDALRWMEIHGGIQGQELAAHWRSLDTGDVPPPAEPGVAFDLGAPAASGPARNWDGEKRRRRRRRRRRRPAGSSTPATPV